MKRISSLFLGSLFLIIGLGTVFAIGEGDQINMAISPIRDEFTVGTGGSTTRQMTFYNNATVPYTVYISTEDCQPGTNYGTPVCTAPRNPGIVDPTISSTWITTDQVGYFTIPAGGSRVINYTVNVPINASPGGHYGAIFFNNPDGAVTGNTVQMNRRIGMLYLLTVPGDIIIDTNLGDILIDGPGGGMSNIGPTSLMTFFSAPSEFLSDLSHQFMMVFQDPEESEIFLNELNPLWEKPTLAGEEDFVLTLKIPIENTGNTHVRPTGKIYLTDGDNRLERIGKQAIVNENGVYLGEKIVDFLPINDEGGNVLPNTDRTYSVEWRGFAYDDIDGTTGTKVVKFESPSSYYSRISSNESQYLLPWQKLAVRNMQKELRADVEVSYRNPLTGLDEVYSLELPVIVSFKYITKALNWSLVVLILLVVLLVWNIIRRNRRLEKLEYETHHLEDEIHALENAQSLLKQKGISSKSKTVEKTMPTKKLVAKGANEAKVAGKNEAKTSTSKKPAPKSATPKAIPSKVASVTDKPSKPPVAKKTTPKAPVAKKTSSEEAPPVKKPATKKASVKTEAKPESTTL